MIDARAGGLFQALGDHGHEQISFFSEPSCGYRGIIAIHDTTLGPALGGRYITAEDVGTSTADMEFIRAETEHVTGLLGKSGDPSPVTAFGVYRGMKAAAKHHWGSDSLSGKTVAVQGCGHVGYFLCKLLHEEGARLVVTDIDAQRVKTVTQDFGAAAVGADEIYSQKADVFAPCALGAVINDATIPKLKAPIVAGGANNVLAEDRHGDELERKGIVYAPDYVINGGGLINVNAELHGWSLERARAKAGEIYDTILRVFEIATEEKIPSYRAADRLAEQRIEAVAKVRQNFV